MTYPSITDNFREISKDLKSNMPRLVIGKKDNIANPNPQPRGLPNVPQASQPAVFSPREEDIISKVRKWAIILSITAVVTYAVYKILF